MRVLSLVGIAGLLMCPLVRVAGDLATADAPAEKDIRSVLQLRLNALARDDMAAYAALVAPAFVGVNDRGTRLDRPALLKDVRPPNGYHVQSSETDFIVRSFGDAAVASYHQSIVGDTHDELAISETYVKADGHWLLAARQEFPIPFAHHPPTKVDPAVFDAYVGDYTVTRGRTVIISREGDKLYEKWPSDDSKVEDIPLSETAFVQPGESSVLTFERDSSGKVVRFVVHFNAHDVVGTKIR